MNRCTFTGNLGRDPEVRALANGDRMCNLSLAVTERWKDKSGERKERTEWVPVVVWGPLVDVCERWLTKGSKVLVAGKWRTRKWTGQDGQDRYSTECVMQGPECVLEMLGNTKGAGAPRQPARPDPQAPLDDFDDIPF